MSAPRGFVEPAPSVAAATQVRTSGGVAIGLTVTITNNAPEPRIFAVTALGVDASWLPRPSRSQPIMPGASIAAVLTLRPNEGTIPARYPLAIAVQALEPVSQQVVSATAVNEVDLIVDAPGQIAISLDPTDTTAVYGKKMTVLLHNSGALPENVHLEVRAPHSAIVDLARAPVFVPPGATVAVRGRVNVTRPAYFRRKARHAYTVTARSGGAPRFAEGSLTARPLFGPVGTKFFAVLAIVAVWVALGFIFIPKLADSVRKNQTNAAPAKTKTSSAAPAKGGTSGSGSGSGQSGQSNGGGSGGGSGGGGSGGGGSGGAAAAGGGSSAAVQLNGTVTGNAPSGVTVALSPTSLGSDDTAGASPVGTSTQSARAGKIPGAALTIDSQSAVSDRSVTTGADGAWSFAKVRAVGYYLVQFSKAGYQTQRFVINASSAIATQPLKVALAAGEGSLHGTVHNAKGGVLGAATIVISDGANTITTSSNSTGGAIGNWSVKGLSTPSTYVVSISHAGLGTESQLVTLGAGGAGTVDLTLRSGVSTLTGRVSALIGSHRTGLGGAQVSATDGTVTRTASTVTTGSQKGRYTLPDLTLGRWSITMQADGYQLQSRTVNVVAGRPQATVNATLSPATAILTGAVRNGARLLVGAGLTLSNTTNTYKQTTDNNGAFSFNGVAPGVYTLTAQYFGMNTSFQTVKAVVGKPAHSAFRLTRTVLTNTSTIVGYVGNAVSSGGSLGCIQDTANKPVLGCWVGFRLTDANGTAVPTRLTDQGTPAPTSIEPPSKTGPTPYILSTVDGLPAGLYQLTMSSPGFIPATVSVRVPLNDIAAAPQVNLFPGNTIGGQINTIGSFDHDGVGGINCVVAVPVGYKTAVFDLTKFTCDEASTDTTKPERPSTIDALQDQCTSNGKTTPGYGIVQDDGSYSITGLCDGRYSTHVVVENPAYDQLSVPAADQTVTHGQTQLYSPHVARKGVMALTEQELDTGTGSANPPSAARSLALTCPAGQPSATVTTDSTGHVQIFGFTAGSVNCSIATTVGAATLSGSTGDVVLFDDNNSSATAILSGGIQPVYGQIVTSYGTGPQPAKNVTLHVDAVTGYDGTTPVIQGGDVVTDDHGCFAVAPVGTSGALPVPDHGCAAGVDTDPTKHHVLELTLTSKSVTVTITSGNATKGAAAQQRTLNGAGDDPFTQISVTAAPASTAGLSFATDPAGLSLNGATLSLLSKQAAGSGTITAGINSAGQLTWQDSNIGLPNMAWQGQYIFKVQVPGFTSALSAMLACGLASDSEPQPTCALTPASLAALGALDGTVRSPSLAPPHTGTALVPGATVIATRCGDSTSTCPTPPAQTSACPVVNPGTDFSTTADSAGHYSFTAPSGRFLLPGKYQLVICAAGMRTTTVPDVTVNGGDDNHQDVRTSLLGGLSGVVSGSNNNSPLSGATVTLFSCFSLPCTQVAQTSTDGGGTYLFTGTPGRYFMDPGAWQVTIAANGFDTKITPLAITSGDNDGSTTITALGGLGGAVISANDGTPVNGATVTLVQCGSADPTTCPSAGGQPTTTDGSGHFQFAGSTGRYFMNVGTWQITVKAPGFVTLVRQLAISSGDNDGSSQLDLLGALSGSVTDNIGGGSPVPGASVSATFCTDGVPCASTDPTTTRTLRTDSSGNYAFSGGGTQNVFKPGTWQLTVSASGYSTSVTTMQILSGANTKLIALGALGSLSGTITGLGVGTQQLSGASVKAQFCGADTTTCTGTQRTTTTDTAGNYSLVGSGTPWSLALGFWKVTAGAFGYLDKFEFVQVQSGANTRDVTVDVRHVSQPVAVLVSGSTSLTKHAIVTLARSDTPATTIPTVLSGTDYIASDLIPTSYSVTVNGDSTATGQSIFPTVVTINVPLSDTGTAPRVTVPISVVQNTVKGVVAGPAGKNGTQTVLGGVTVELGTGPSASSFTVDENVGGDPLSVVTANDGTFKLSGIPNGTYSVRINSTNPKDGYQPTFLNSGATVQFGFTQDLGTVSLTRRTQQVNVTVTLPSGDTLLGAAADAGTLTNADDSTWTTSSGAVGSAAGQVTWSFNDVPYGCWSFAATLPNLHFGTLTQTGQGDTGDGALSCGTGTFPVRGDQDNKPGSPAYALHEDPLDLLLSVTNYDGGPLGAGVKLTVTKSGASSATYTNGAFPTGSPATRVWLADGNYGIDVSVPGSATEWPSPATKSVTMSSGSNANQGSVSLTEALSKLTVSYPGAAVAHPITIKLKCLAASQTVPANCGTAGTVHGVDKGSGITFSRLAPGQWEIHATGSIPPATIDKTQTVTLTPGATSVVSNWP